MPNPEEIELGDDETAAANPEEIDIDNVVSDGEDAAAGAAGIAADEVPEGDAGPGAAPAAAALREHEQQQQSGARIDFGSSSVAGGGGAGLRVGVSFNAQQGSGLPPPPVGRRKLSSAMPAPKAAATVAPPPTSANPEEIELPE